MEHTRVFEEATEEDLEDYSTEDDHSSAQTKHLPKRVLAFTSKKLLSLLSKCSKGSVDGTFKSCNKMWRQQFVLMVKGRNGHWIPVIYAWLPDKSVVSYKVGDHLKLL